MLLAQLIDSFIASYKYSINKEENLVFSKSCGLLMITDFIYTQECGIKTFAMSFYGYGWQWNWVRIQQQMYKDNELTSKLKDKLGNKWDVIEEITVSIRQNLKCIAMKG